MSRKTKRNQMPPERHGRHGEPTPEARRRNRRNLFTGVAVAMMIIVVAGTLLYRKDAATPSPADSTAPLVSEHSPMLGDASAKVHIVEFIDPACETCAAFYPLVKQLLADNPGKIRLSMRHVALHTGSEYVVRVLEASREQDKYWPTLEILLSSQAAWAPHHTVQPELVDRSIAGAGLNLEQLRVDMSSPEVTRRIEQDHNDAVALKVTATPEYFVNGRGMPSFGEQQLRALVGQALQEAY